MHTILDRMGSHANAALAIDKQGDLILNVLKTSENIENVPSTNQVASMRVSSQVLTQSSNVFNVLIKSRDFFNGGQLNLYGDNKDTVKLWMEVLHKSWRGDHFYKADIPLPIFSDAVGFGEKYELNLRKLKVWWSLWLGTRVMGTFTVEDLEIILHLCRKFDHPEGHKVLQILLDERRGIMHPEFPNAYKNYPPSFMRSWRQWRNGPQQGGSVHVEDHESLGLSMMFNRRYGAPMYYRDFYRLVTTPFNVAAVPKIQTFDALMRKGTSSTFLSFCRMVDNKTNQMKLPPFTRREMESAWAWIAFQLYDKQFDPSVCTDRTSADLHNVLRMRFHPKGKIENYWQEKKEKNHWTDGEIVRLEDGCEEPQYDEDGDAMMNEDNEDANEDEDEDEVMLDLEEKFEGLGVGLTVEFLES